jgi:hypothetical protein
MLESIKNSSLLTKILYLFAFILFIIWVIPTISSYYANLSSYEKSVEELKSISSKHGLSTKTQKFPESSFKQNTELLFSTVEIKNLGEKLYEVYITMKKEDLKNFHTFIETISLRYYVEIKNDLEFKTEDETIHVKMTLKAF